VSDDTIDRALKDLGCSHVSARPRAYKQDANDRGLVLDAEAAELAICEVELDLAAQRTFRAAGEHVADDKHPNHQHRIYRGRPIVE
jgi:hypothetical protein